MDSSWSPVIKNLSTLTDVALFLNVVHKCFIQSDLWIKKEVKNTKKESNWKKKAQFIYVYMCVEQII